MTHPQWGSAEIACDRQPAPLPEPLIEHTLALSNREKGRARLSDATVAVRVHTRQKHVLRGRKCLLFRLRALIEPDGVIAIDGSSTLLWSQAILDDELAHDHRRANVIGLVHYIQSKGNRAASDVAPFGA